METIGFIGLGNMGLGMSRNIQRAGYPMVVYDIREEATKPLLEHGARLASSPAEVARLSDVTFSSLPGPSEVEAVATGPEGVLGGIREGGRLRGPVDKPPDADTADRAAVPPEGRACCWTPR